MIRINNLSNCILKEIPEYHPDSSRYLIFWREQFRRIIEGFWFPDDENVDIDVENYDWSDRDVKWRFAPPVLYFYGNFGTILHKEDDAPKTAAKTKKRPSIRDVEWEIYYDIIIARGFSGFSEDDEYTCCDDLINESYSIEDYDDSCFKKDGTLKKYINAQTYVRQLFDKPMGYALYNNGAKNYMILSTRGLGKSYSVAGIISHELITDGRKRYVRGDKNVPIAEQFVGSAIAAKSLDLMRKVKLTIDNLPGAWKPNTDDYVPSPLYKDMSGSIQAGKKWVHEYEKKVGGEWVKGGTKSNITHGVFTVENPEAAAGGRYTQIVVEEVGLVPNILTIHSSNDAAQAGDDYQMGSSIYLGTGGNVEKVVESETIFRNPEAYNMLSFEDEWEETGKICRFFPASMRLNKYKDKNGNTDLKKATKFFEIRREQKKKGKNQKAYFIERMNYPLVPSDMFLSKGNSFFPVQDAKETLSILQTNTRITNSFIRAEFSFDKEGNVKFNHSDKPTIDDFPINIMKTDTNASCLIFEQPRRDRDGEVFSNRYIAGLDPVDDDDINEDNSLQSMFILDMFTDRIVAEYTGRTLIVSDWYEQARRLMLYYNAVGNVENNRKGLYGHFRNKLSMHLLCDVPTILSDKGYVKAKERIGNKSKGTPAGVATNKLALELTADWLNSKDESREGEFTKTYSIRSIALLKEIMKWNKDLNTDRVSALGMLMILRADKFLFTQSNKNSIENEEKDDILDDPFFNRYKK